jgi:hypothetical protein
MLLSVALLSACGTPPIQQDQPVVLASGQGLAAIVLDTLDPLEQVTFVSSDGNNKLTIAALPIGLNLYLFQVPAGDYCFTRFQFGRWNFFPQDKVQQFGCFAVKAGQLGYSGTLSPRVINGEEMTHQQFEPESFRDLLAQRYPIIAKQFMASLTPPPPPPAPSFAPEASTAAVPLVADKMDLSKLKPKQSPSTGKDQVSSWAEQIGDTRSQVVFLRNNTLWTLQVANFEVYDCAGVKQICGVMKGNIILPPHVTKAVVQIDPASAYDAYAYRTRFVYGFVQNATP